MTNSMSVGRSGLRLRRSLLRVSTILCTGLAPAFLATPAAAQVAAPAPVRQSIDGNGVDLFLGTMNVDGPVLSAGQGEPQGLSYRKSARGGNGWGDNVVATLTVSGSTVLVGFGGATDRFTLSGGSYSSTEGDGATLSLSGTVYTYTTSDGTVAHFDQAKASGPPYATITGLVTDVTRPNGAALSYAYTSLSYCASTKPGGGGDVCLAHRTAYRIASAQSGSGYKIMFDYAETDPPEPDVVPDNTFWQTWGTMTGVSMTNTAVSGASTRSQSFASSYSGGSNYYTITDPMSRTSTFRMAAPGVAGIKRPGKTAEDITVTYDSANKVASVTTPVGTTTYAYADASGVRTTTVTDPGGHASVYTFDIATQRMLSATNPLSQTTQWQYDSSGRVTKITAPENNYVQYGYDARGNVVSTTAVKKAGSGADDIVTSASYDTSCSNTATCNSPNSTTDANGNVTDYTYDSGTGDLLSVTAPAAVTSGTRPKTTYTYTTSGGVTLVSGVSTCQTTASCAGTPDEVKTTIAYNANLLPASVSKGAGDASLTATTAIGYDDVGNRTTVDGPLSGSDDTVTYRYDADREVVGVISPDPDGSGSLKRRATRASYNDRGIATMVESGTVTGTSDSDWAGFVSLQQVTTTLGAADRQAKVVGTAGGTTYSVAQYSYDADGRLDCTAIRMNPASWASLPTACTATTGGGDPDRIARTTYDNADRPTKTTSAYGTPDASDEATAVYSANGKVVSLTDAENNRTSYDYDGFDRLTKTNYPNTAKGDAGANPPSSYEELGYDANGNVTSRRLRDGASIYYGYDALNRLTYKNLPGSEPDVAYSYDLLGRLTLAIDATSNYAGFAYDALGRPTAQSGPLGVVGMGYDLAGRRTSLVWPDNFYVTYSYDTAGEMTAIKESGTTTLAGFAYDDLGRRTALTRGNGVTTSYSYDAGSRLTTLAQDPAGTTSDLSLGFSYNSAGQIATATRSNDAYSWTSAVNVTRGYTSNGLNQYTAAGPLAMTYDAKGNVTASGSDAYTYSSENLMLTGPNGAALVYDPLLRLAQVSNTTTVASRFLYDGQSIIGQATGSGTFDRRYVLVPGSDEVLVEYKINAGTKNWKLADERGSVIASTDASGNLLGYQRYDEYGIPSATNSMRYQYTGQVWLGEIGMYYYKARMYSPTLGRFMQPDPIGYGDGMNWYNYTGGDPVNLSDPSGLLAARHCHDGTMVIGDVGCVGGLGGHSAISNDPYLEALNSNRAFLGYGGGGNEALGSQSAVNPCNTIVQEKGKIAYYATNYGGIFGGGMTVATGSFENLTTGSTGDFVTVGLGLGLNLGIGQSRGVFESMTSFKGYNQNIEGSVALIGGIISVGGSASQDSKNKLVGGGFGITISPPTRMSIPSALTIARIISKLALSATASETTLTHCVVGNK